MAARRKPRRLHVVDTSDANPTGEARPVVRIIAGKRSEAIDDAEAHLTERDLDLFQRGDFVVRLAPQDVDFGDGERVSAMRIVTVGSQHMRERFTRAVDLQKFDKRSENWVSIDCPNDFAEAYLERIGAWKLPPLRGVATAPSLRPDGSINDSPGYDRATSVYYDPRGVEFPRVPVSLSKADALAALEKLDSLLGTFDFVDEIDRSVARSGILTAVLRRAMSAAPMHGVTAPVAGSGKSKLVSIPAILATGHPAPVIALGRREEEAEKRLGAVQIAGDQVITIDNAEGPIGGELMCQAVTEPLVTIRILGTSSRLIVPNSVTWFATGNNLKFAGDMARRALLCRLDPRCERPELREFETPDPGFVAQRDRPRLVVAALTIARAFAIAGCPREAPPLGSFADWSKWVRDPLLWLGCVDPVDAMGEVRREDPKLSALAGVLEQWSIAIDDRRVTAREVAEIAGQMAAVGLSHPDLREALLTVAADRGEISTRRLGRWLGENKGREVAGKRIVPCEMEHGIGRWQLARLAHK